MKLTLVRPSYHSVWEPINLLYLAGYIRKFMPETEIKILDGCFESEDQIVREAVNSDFVGFTGTTAQLDKAVHYAKEIKEQNSQVKTVFGGFGATFQPEKCQKYADHIVRGEGEEALRLIVSGEADSKIISLNPIENIDNIPFPARDLINLERYISIAEREEGRRVTSVVTERGCVFNCRFCNEGHGHFWNICEGTKKVRLRKASKIVDEMEQIRKQYRITFFKVSDAETNPTKQHFISICKELISRRWNTNWAANMRVDKVDDEICKWANKGCCTEFSFGVESGSPEILKHFNKGITAEMTRKAFKACKKHGVLARAHVILGAPPESYDTIKETEELLDEINPDLLGFTILVPYPGTFYYEQFKKEFPDVDWGTIDNYGNTYWHSNYLTNEELRHEQARLMEKYNDKLAPIVRKKSRLGVIK